MTKDRSQPSGGSRKPRPKRGFTLIEIVTGAGLVLLALTGFARIVAFAGMHTEADREIELVRLKAEQLLTELRWTEFDEVFALYNEDPFDDPQGIDTAPGMNINVEGMRPALDGPPGPIGRIYFPTVFDFDEGLQLREDVLDPRMGMPRDLNGDGQVDHRDHASDYALLPVRIRFEWVGVAGPSELEVETLLADH